MFTIEEIKMAHAKVKSGADFPAYIQALIHLGVQEYETYVTDGHAIFNGENGFTAQKEAGYETLEIAESCNPAEFRKDLVEHQQGKTDYFTFCVLCAASGIEKWVVRMAEMTCTYYDKVGNEVLQEAIPVL